MYRKSPCIYSLENPLPALCPAYVMSKDPAQAVTLGGDSEALQTVYKWSLFVLQLTIQGASLSVVKEDLHNRNTVW